MTISDFNTSKNTLQELLESRKAVHFTFVVSILDEKCTYESIKKISSPLIEKAIAEKTLALVLKNEVLLLPEFALANELTKGQQVLHPLKRIQTTASVRFFTDEEKKLIIDELYAYIDTRAVKELRRLQRRFSIISLKLQQEADAAVTLPLRIHKYTNRKYFFTLNQLTLPSETILLSDRKAEIIPRALLSEFKNRKNRM